MSSNTELVGVVETVRNVCIEMATGGSFSYEKYEAERQKVLSYPEIKAIIPDWLIKARYGQQYWTFISTKFSSYAERRNFLRGEFEDMINNIRSGLTRPVSISVENSLKILNEESVSKLWQKVIERSQSDPEGAITASKSLLETVMKYVLDKENVDYTKNDDFIVLYKLVKKSINLDPRLHNSQTFKQILTGITTVIQGFGSLRNDYGDAHGKGKTSYVTEQRHAELVINLAGSLCSFILETYNSRVNP